MPQKKKVIYLDLKKWVDRIATWLSENESRVIVGTIGAFVIVAVVAVSIGMQLSATQSRFSSAQYVATRVPFSVAFFATPLSPGDTLDVSCAGVPCLITPGAQSVRILAATLTPTNTATNTPTLPPTPTATATKTNTPTATWTVHPTITPTATPVFIPLIIVNYPPPTETVVITSSLITVRAVDNLNAPLNGLGIFIEKCREPGVAICANYEASGSIVTGDQSVDVVTHHGIAFYAGPSDHWYRLSFYLPNQAPGSVMQVYIPDTNPRVNPQILCQWTGSACQ